MSKPMKLLLVALLTAVALSVSVPKASAINWCQLCASSDACFACCRCNGGSPSFCTTQCTPG